MRPFVFLGIANLRVNLRVERPRWLTSCGNVRDRLWPTHDELRSLSEDDLRREHDKYSGEVQNPTIADFYLTELRHREFSRRERWMVVMTIAIAVMTLAILGLTIANRLFLIYD